MQQRGIFKNEGNDNEISWVGQDRDIDKWE